MKIFWMNAYVHVSMCVCSSTLYINEGAVSFSAPKLFTIVCFFGKRKLYIGDF
jgi:hypothetical protein